MHPIALFLAATDAEGTYGATAERDRRPRFAAVDALPLTEPEPVSRLSRLTARLASAVRSGATDSRAVDDDVAQALAVAHRVEG